jgi:beta-glucosidase/6-phospho-beta-glucosidase/beta-galactosidase
MIPCDIMKKNYIFRERFGLYFVDFDDPKRPRKKKQSAEYFKRMIANWELPDV